MTDKTDNTQYEVIAAISELSQAESRITYQAKTEDRLCTAVLRVQIKNPDMTAAVGN